MKRRSYWIRKVEAAWTKKTVVWLYGVRRAGKTVLCQSLPDIEYFDCELPSARRAMDDPEAFLEDLRGRRVVLDEVHRLVNPSELLKIAADHYPDVRLLATGSSTLQASARFRDTLTGRKAEVWLPPMISKDLKDFGGAGLPERLLKGGLPPFFLSETPPEREFQEWVDSYWAKDVQELFRLERRASFQRFLEMVFASSGGIFEATRFARPCEISRTTVSNYLGVLEATWVAHVIRPFSTHRPTEIVSAPKVYAFDTGFACYYRGWRSLRTEDLGLLWEHYVLNEIMGRTQGREVRYWRDKRAHEVDFILARRGAPPVAIECKWTPESFEPAGLQAFRRQYLEGENYIVCPNLKRSFTRSYRGLAASFVNLETLAERLKL